MNLVDVLRITTPEANEEELEILAHKVHDLDGMALEGFVAGQIFYAYELGCYIGQERTLSLISKQEEKRS